MLASLESEEVSIDVKNQVVWVLGELRDERALDALQALVVSEPCDHGHCVCQKELIKAIRKIRGDIPNPYRKRLSRGV